MNEPDFSAVHTLRQELLSQLEVSKSSGVCALMAYPHYFNIGDHLIWLACCYWLTRISGLRITYASGLYSFRPRDLAAQVPEGSTIYFRGGGNLGDLWPIYQRFRESVIESHPRHRIVIFPQSIHFRDASNLERAKRIFNSHPNLTVYLRDTVSFAIAQKEFPSCRVLLAPDISLLLDFVREDFTKVSTDPRALYLCRADQEFDGRFRPDSLGVPDLLVHDWETMRIGARYFQRVVRHLPFLWSFFSAIGQGDLSGSTYGARLKALSQDLCGLPAAFSCSRSLRFLLSGAAQIKRHRVVITNRLHGHLLSVLLGVPNVFLPNAYHKNESFYNSWTSRVPYARFVKRPEEVAQAVRELGALRNAA